MVKVIVLRAPLSHCHVLIGNKMHPNSKSMHFFTQSLQYLLYTLQDGIFQISILLSNDLPPNGHQMPHRYSYRPCLKGYKCWSETRSMLGNGKDSWNSVCQISAVRLLWLSTHTIAHNSRSIPSIAPTFSARSFNGTFIPSFFVCQNLKREGLPKEHGRNLEWD